MSSLEAQFSLPALCRAGSNAQCSAAALDLSNEAMAGHAVEHGGRIAEEVDQP